MDNSQFEQKWKAAEKKVGGEEPSLYVEKGTKPETQRQFSLLHFYEYIEILAKKHGSKKAIEVGCGRGTVALYLDKYLGLDIVAVDISDDAVNLAIENFRKHGGRGKIMKADASKLPMPDDTFDISTSIGLVEHFNDYSEIFREQYRVLKKGGMMISLNIPKKNSIQVLNTIYRFLLFWKRKTLQRDYFRNTDTPEEYKSVAEFVGFKDVSTFYVNPFPFFVPLGKKNDMRLTKIWNVIYAIRGRFMKYPFSGSKLLCQAHFLIGWKK